MNATHIVASGHHNKPHSKNGGYMRGIKRKANSNLCTTHPINIEYARISQCWMLNALVVVGGYKNLIREQACQEDDVLHALGLSQLLEQVDFDSAAARHAIFQLYETVNSRNQPQLPGDTRLAKNIAWMGQAVGLNQTEQTILHFRIVASRNLTLRACLDLFGQGVDLLYAIHLLANILSIPQAEIEEALSPNSRLINTGLIQTASGLANLLGKIQLLDGLADNLMRQHSAPYDVFRSNFLVATPAKLTVADYPHLQAHTTILTSYLNKCIAQNRHGVNILIYGPPGSGKTEFVKALASELGTDLFEIATECDEGNPIRQSQRLSSFRLSQHILGRKSTVPLIMFDEIEDVFQHISNRIGGTSNRSGLKGFINKQLENNPVPAFWLSNNLNCIDNAYIRRFDFIIELNAPPRSVRAKILDRYLSDTPVSDHWRKTVAEHDGLSPAVIERATQVTKLACEQTPDLSIEKTLTLTLGNTLNALDMQIPLIKPAQASPHYRLEVLNVDCNITQLCEGLKAHGGGRICLYGPPGTGKTALGKHLSQVFDKPLIVRRASDILGPFVGQTEHNMAAMFREASDEGAVLLLDEADTFLRDRNDAHRSWEISQVNEMLTQMESFDGIFIASTNLMNSLDTAALRRFDMKIKFDFLNPDQAYTMFQDTLDQLNLKTEAPDYHKISGLKLLTPGDFANVLRQSNLRKITSAAELIERLTAECAIKPQLHKQPIGFHMAG